MNTKSQMPLVLLISMEKSKARRARAIAALEKLGLQYEWVRAIDGNELSDAEVAKIQIKRRLGKGGVGCYLSHLKCYRLMRERNLPYAIIMEDDMEPDENLLDVLARLDRFPADWDVVNLAPWKGLVGDKIRAFHHQNLRHRTALGDGLFVCKYFWGAGHAGLYLITARYFTKFEKDLLPIYRPIDGTLFELKYSLNFPYAVYREAQGRYFAVQNANLDDSEIDKAGRWPKRDAKRDNHAPVSPNLKKRLFDLLVATYFTFDPLFLRVMLNMRWRDSGKRHYLHSDRTPGSIRIRLMIWRSCDWRSFPLALVRAMLPQRWL